MHGIDSAMHKAQQEERHAARIPETKHRQTTSIMWGEYEVAYSGCAGRDMLRSSAPVATYDKDFWLYAYAGRLDHGQERPPRGK